MTPAHAPSASRGATDRRARRQRLELLSWAALEACPLDAVVTSRHGGVSAGPYASLNLAFHVGDERAAVLENRRRAAAAIGGSLDDLVVAAQVHGSTVAVVGAAERGRGSRSTHDAVAGADALVTTRRDVVLAVLVADCAPIVLIDPVARVLGCAHAGWRGTTGGVLEATLQAMTGLGARLERVQVGIGPAVSADRYEVGSDVVTAAAHLGHLDELAVEHGPGRWLFDLRRAARAALVRSGVEAHAITTMPFDTGPPGPFFSARATPTCGRFALLARLVPGPRATGT